MLSPRKTNISSPRKENILQREYKTMTREQLLALINEMESTINKSGLHHSENNGNGVQRLKNQIKLFTPSNQSPNKEMKKMRIKLNDCQFQLKKLQQDYAEYKVKARMEKEKQVKKLVEENAKLKKQVEEDSLRWEKRFEERDLIYQQECEHFKSSVKQQKQRQIQELKTSYHQQIQILNENLKSLQKTLNQQYQNQIESLSQKHKLELQQLQEQHESERKKVLIEKKQALQAIQRKNEEKNIVMEGQKKVEMKKHEKTKEQYNKLKEKLYNDLYYVRRQKDELKKTIEQLKFSSKEWKVKYQQKCSEVDSLKKQYEEKVHEIEEKFKNDLAQFKAINMKSNKQITFSHKQQISQLTQKLLQLDQCKVKMIEQLRTTHFELQQKFDIRPSKKEDTERLSKQTYELFIKDEELRQLKQELKYTKREHENNERNYTRIFSANGSRDKRTKMMTTPKQRVMKNGNTVDLSSLMKLCQKNF